MKLKLYIIDQIAGILAGVKINKVEDKAAKSALMQDYLALRKVLKAAQEDKDEIVRKFQEDWKDELAAVEAYRREKKPVVGHLDYLEAERDAKKAISDIFDREVEMELEKVPETPLFNPALWGENVTLEQIPGSIEFLKDNGIILET